MRDLLLDTLATYRITRLLTTDDLLSEPREALVEWSERRGRHELLRLKVGTLATCPWCLSAWCGLLVVALRRFAPRSWDPLAKALAFSAVTGLVASREDG